MTRDRYMQLMGHDKGCPNADLNDEEIAEGWHFCWEFDGLLVGPGMKGELKFCNCIPEDHPARFATPTVSETSSPVPGSTLQ